MTISYSCTRNHPWPRIVTAIAAAGIAVGCERPAPPALERPPAPVAVATVVQQDVPVYLDEIGRCVAREMVAAQPQVSGQIQAIHFTDGAHVRQGELLFTIDPRPFEAQLEAAQAVAARNQAALDLARLEFDRFAGLLDTKAISQQDYDVRKNQVATSEAQLKESMAQVEMARIDLEYCFIHSPIDGRAGQRLVDVGNVVNSIGSPNGNTTLVTIQRLDPIYADFTTTESNLTAVQRSMQRGRPMVEVRIPDEGGTPMTGELTFLDNSVQQETGTVKLRATIPNPEFRLWPGRFIQVRVVLDTLRDTVLVPAVAPQLSANGQFVYVVKDDSTAELRPVKLGQRQGTLIVVEDGVKAGERVVTHGQMGVMPGGQVHVHEPGVAPGAAPPPGGPA